MFDFEKMDSIAKANWIKEQAYALGFEFCGISKAEELTDEARQLEAWLNKGLHGKMQYMENHFEKRIDPRKLVDNAKTVVSLLYNYYNPATQQDENAPKISMYAYGEDYHDVIREKLNYFLSLVREKFGDINGRTFVDSAPVMEREWAKRSGIGWLGKNTLLIHPKRGSYFFLAELIIDLELAPDNAITDFCGRCTRCIDACPTDAIAPNGYLLDSSKCISYLTIELKEEINAAFAGKMDNWMYGCDVCQTVCPWNRFSKPHDEDKFLPKEGLLDMTAADWQALTQETFNIIFKNTAVKRTKYKGLRRNIDFLSQ
jgi:epoxyqueuosine reductase